MYHKLNPNRPLFHGLFFKANRTKDQIETNLYYNLEIINAYVNLTIRLYNHKEGENMNGTETKERVSIKGWANGELTIHGLTQEERGRLEASINSGQFWTRVVDERLSTINAFEATPNPTTDREMMPFWRAPTEDEKRILHGQLKLFSFEKLERYASPAIMIQHLCGYNWSQENYKHQAELLKSYGFEIMRSQRGEDGKYWEMWYLPGLWSAKGDLEIAIKSSRSTSERGRLRAATDFLGRHVQFGTLDVCIQRMAMSAPD